MNCKKKNCKQLMNSLNTNKNKFNMIIQRTKKINNKVVKKKATNNKKKRIKRKMTQIMILIHDLFNTLQVFKMKIRNNFLMKFKIRKRSHLF